MEKSEDRIFFAGSVEFAGWRRLHQGQRPVKVLPSTFYPSHLFVRVFLVRRFSFPCNFTLLPPQTCCLSSPYLIWSFPFFSPPFHLPFLSPLAYLPNFGRFFIRSPVSFTRCIRIFFSKYWYLLSFLRFLRLCSELFQWYFLGSFVDFGLRILRRKHTLGWIFNETYDFNYNRTTFI